MITLWLRTHYLRCLRHGGESLLIVVVILTGWHLFANIRSGFSPAEISPSQPVLENLSPRFSDTAWASQVAGDHLFGMLAAATKDIPIAATDAMTLAGILYATNSTDSRAIILINGQTVIAAPGTKLPDGETVASIELDRILVDRGGTIASILLAIQMADPNSRFQLAGLKGDNVPSFAPDPVTSNMPARAPSGRDSDNAATTEAIHGTFLPLSEIRGRDAKQRFKDLQLPTLAARRFPTPKH